MYMCVCVYVSFFFIIYKICQILTPCLNDKKVYNLLVFHKI